MPFSAYSATPSANTSIAGIDIGEGCPPGNVNDAIRQIMADAKTFTGSGSRPKLSADLNLYVRTTGADTNTGLTNDSAGAFLTIQAALNAIFQNYDLNGYEARIYVADGTYTGQIAMYGMPLGARVDGGKAIRIIGNVGAYANVQIAPASGRIIDLDRGAQLYIEGVDVSTASGDGIVLNHYSVLEVSNLGIGAIAGTAIEPTFFSMFRAEGPVTVHGGGTEFIHATKGAIVDFATQVLTFSGTPSWTGYLYGLNNAYLNFDSGRVIGTALGGTGGYIKPVLVHLNSVINYSSVSSDQGTMGAPALPAEHGDPFMGNEIDLDSGGRIYNELLESSHTWYVNASAASDFTDGLTSGRPFKTITGALKWLSKQSFDWTLWIDPSTTSNVLSVAAGTYTEDLFALDNHFGTISVIGAGTTTILNGQVTAKDNRKITVRSLTLNGKASGYGLYSVRGGQINFQDITFGTATSLVAHIYADDGGRVIADANYAIRGAATAHVWTNARGIVDTKDRTVTITNTPAFSQAYAYADSGGMYRCDGMTFTGSATGKRYDVRATGLIYTNGTSPASYLPGNATGTSATSGLYA